MSLTWTDFAAIAQAAATLVLVLVTWRYMQHTRELARQAERQADSAYHQMRREGDRSMLSLLVRLSDDTTKSASVYSYAMRLVAGHAAENPVDGLRWLDLFLGIAYRDKTGFRDCLVRAAEAHPKLVKVKLLPEHTWLQLALELWDKDDSQRSHRLAEAERYAAVANVGQAASVCDLPSEVPPRGHQCRK